MVRRTTNRTNSVLDAKIESLDFIRKDTMRKIHDKKHSIDETENVGALKMGKRMSKILKKTTLRHIEELSSPKLAKIDENDSKNIHTFDSFASHTSDEKPHDSIESMKRTL